jgi:hypothetical protein
VLLPMPAPIAWPFVLASSALQVGYMLLLTSGVGRRCGCRRVGRCRRGR